MPLSVCVRCEKEMKPEKNGIYVEEHTHLGGPYRIWMAELYKCRSCNIEIVTGFGRIPIANHPEPNYAEEQKRVTHHIR